MGTIQVKRIYQPVEDNDGRRILVDRLWPRGISKANAQIDEWAKDIAPTRELRQWYHAHTEQYDEFRVRYHQELDANPKSSDFRDSVLHCLSEGDVTFVTASSLSQNNATALREYIS